MTPRRTAPGAPRPARCGCCGRPFPARPTPARLVAAEYPGLPVSEMLARGWLGDDTTISDAAELRRRLLRFFEADTEPQLRHLLGLPPAP